MSPKSLQFNVLTRLPILLSVACVASVGSPTEHGPKAANPDSPFDGESRWQMRVLCASVAARPINSPAWDDFGCHAPDPYVYILVSGVFPRGHNVALTTPVEDDIYETQWNEPLAVKHPHRITRTDFAANLLINGHYTDSPGLRPLRVEIGVFDSDLLGSYTTVANCRATFDETMFAEPVNVLTWHCPRNGMPVQPAEPMAACGSPESNDANGGCPQAHSTLPDRGWTITFELRRSDNGVSGQE